MAGKWQAAIREEQGLALLQRRSRQQLEIIEQLSKAQGLSFPTDATVFVARDSGQKDLLNKFLNDLGVLPGGTSVDTLYRLPAVSNMDFSREMPEILTGLFKRANPQEYLMGEQLLV